MSKIYNVNVSNARNPLGHYEDSRNKLFDREVNYSIVSDAFEITGCNLELKTYYRRQNDCIELEYTTLKVIVKNSLPRFKAQEKADKPYSDQEKCNYIMENYEEIIKIALKGTESGLVELAYGGETNISRKFDTESEAFEYLKGFYKDAGYNVENIEDFIPVYSGYSR